MRDRKVAARYARALLAALPDDQQAEEIDEFLAALGKGMEDSDDFRALMLDPAVPNGVRFEVRDRIAFITLARAERGNSLPVPCMYMKPPSEFWLRFT